MFADNLKKLRKNKGFSQEGLAEYLHVTRQTISKWERGYSVPDADLLIHLANILEVDVRQLLGETMEQEDPSNLDILAEKLEQINRQLIKRNRWGSMIVKVILAVFIGYLTICFVSMILSYVAYGNYQTSVKTTVEKIE